MIGKILFAVLAFGFLLSGAANAELSANWVVCDGCTSQTQFNNAAKNWVGQRTGEFDVNVGNSVSSVVYSVYVYSGRDGDVIASTPPIRASNGIELASKSHDVAFGFSSHVSQIAVSGNEPQGTGNYYEIWSSFRQSASLEEMFGFVVNLHKTEYIVPAPEGYGFESYYGADMALVSPYLYNSLTVGVWGWQYSEVGAASMGSLLNALKSLFGRGPKACIVFNNGDLACYQVNVLDPNAALYLANTALNINNQSIDTGGGVGSGVGGTSVTHVGGNIYRFGSGGEFWLVCNNITEECYVEYIPY